MNQVCRRIVLILSFASALVLESQSAERQRPKQPQPAAKALPRPAVAIVIDPAGRNSGNELSHWDEDLANAVDAHTSVGQSVTVFYQKRIPKLEARVKELCAKPKSGWGEVECDAFESGDAAASLVNRWLTFHLTPDLATKPITPFAYLIVIGHGEAADRKDRCLRCAEGLFNASEVERKCSKAHFPLISVLHMCASPGLAESGNEPKAIAVPTIPVDVSAEGALEAFVRKGIESGGALPDAWAAGDIVCHIASAPLGSTALSDGLFLKAYRDAFRLDGKQFVENRKAGMPESRNLRLRHLTQRMSVAATTPDVAADDEEKKKKKKVEQRPYVIRHDRSAITLDHIIASTHPTYAFKAPAISVLKNFSPNVDVDQRQFDGVSFEVVKNTRYATIAGNGRQLNRPYAAVNCVTLLDGDMPLEAKVLYVEMKSNAAMQLSFMRNKTREEMAFDMNMRGDQSMVQTLRRCNLVGGRPSGVRVAPPNIGYFVETDRPRGLSLTPIDPGTGGPNQRGWVGGQNVVIGPMLLTDVYDTEGETVHAWRRWEAAHLTVSLDERWIPQRWWRSDDDVALAYTPADLGQKTGSKFVVSDDAVIGVGGPVCYRPEILVPENESEGRAFGLDVEIYFTDAAPDKSKTASVLVFGDGEVVGSLRLEEVNRAKSGKMRAFVKLAPEAVVNYMAIVMHGRAAFEIRNIRLGWTDVRP